MDEEMYRVHCTECGELIENKFFPLDNLLGQYNGGAGIGVSIIGLVKFLGIGAMYGQTVLPQVSPFLGADEKWNFEKPGISAGEKLPEFECMDNAIPIGVLKAVNLNIASMVAQFYLITGFHGIYPMLALWQKKETTRVLSNADQQRWEDYCSAISQVPGVYVDPLLSSDERNRQIARHFSFILQLAKEEAKTPLKRHFANPGMSIGWRYKIENNRKMPYALVVRSGLTGIYDCINSCCDKCRQPLSWEMGAYKQKVVGILGTQAVGKTTYLMALADVIPQKNFKNMSIVPAADPQWDRVKAENGLLWKYQHGFSPEKTQVAEGAAPALSFKVKKGVDSEPIMYTLADIPGEVFYDSEHQKYSPSLTNAIKKLLDASDSLILVVNSGQLQMRMEAEETASEENGRAGRSIFVNDSMKILDSFKKYLPPKKIPTAVVLTAADKLGDLRKLLGLAFDVRNVQPLTVLDKAEKGKDVYNAEMMSTVSRAVSEYMNSRFNQFMHNLQMSFIPKGSALAAFAVSSGTQCAEEFDPSFDKAKAKERYAKMCEARFGVAVPLLWLLACDGLLDPGRADLYEQYAQDDRERILEVIAGKQPDCEANTREEP